MILQAGDTVTVKSRKKSQDLGRRGLEISQNLELSAWLKVDRDGMKGEILHVPSREEIAPFVNEQLVVELYSK